MDAHYLSRDARQAFIPSHCPLPWTGIVRNATSMRHWLELLDSTLALNWQAEHKARAITHSLFWPESDEEVTLPKNPQVLASAIARAITIVIRSQILREVEPPGPEDLDDREQEKQRAIRSWQAASYSGPYSLHPGTATGKTRPLRPPGIEVEPIRAPPHARKGHTQRRTLQRTSKRTPLLSLLMGIDRLRKLSIWLPLLLGPRTRNVTSIIPVSCGHRTGHWESPIMDHTSRKPRETTCKRQLHVSLSGLSGCTQPNSRRISTED
jgi:hypothetical protein